MVHSHCRTSKLIVPIGEEGKGLHFQLADDTALSDLAFGSSVNGSVMIDGRALVQPIDLASGIYAICAINCILQLEYLKEHEDFLIFVEKQFMGISRSSHTALSSSLIKAVNKYPKEPKKKQTSTQPIASSNTSDVPATIQNAQNWSNHCTSNLPC